jgi:hypothetical protein
MPGTMCNVMRSFLCMEMYDVSDMKYEFIGLIFFSNLLCTSTGTRWGWVLLIGDALFPRRIRTLSPEQFNLTNLLPSQDPPFPHIRGYGLELSNRSFPLIPTPASFWLRLIGGKMCVSSGWLLHLSSLGSRHYRLIPVVVQCGNGVLFITLVHTIHPLSLNR